MSPRHLQRQQASNLAAPFARLKATSCCAGTLRTVSSSGTASAPNLSSLAARPRPRAWLNWQQLLGAFCTGALLTYLGLALAGSHGIARLPLGRSLSASSTAASSNTVCAMPRAQGIALTPLALGNTTGNVSLVPDRLIVAARHREVSQHTSAAVQLVHMAGRLP